MLKVAATPSRIRSMTSKMALPSSTKPVLSSSAMPLDGIRLESYSRRYSVSFCDAHNHIDNASHPGTPSGSISSIRVRRFAETQVTLGPMPQWAPLEDSRTLAIKRSNWV